MLSKRGIMALTFANVNDKKLIDLVDRFFSFNKSFSSFDNDEYFIFPGFCDVHVHFREPGFVYKEDISSGSAAAARGGYTAVCTMPNLDPVPDSFENLNLQLSLIKKKACIEVYPYASITQGQKGEKLSKLLNDGAKVVGFSDDGKGIQNEEMMLEAMSIAKRHGAMIVAHCEDNSLLCGGYIHKGRYASEHNHKGICSESEYLQIERDLKLAKQTNCSYHVCHISTKESVKLIRKAKAEGVDVTCETAPHYLVLSDKDLKESGDFKMNPPIRSESDRLALIDGIKDGTIDMIATDHAPHSREEKSLGLEKSAFGIVGLETAFPVLYTRFVKTNIISMQKLIELLCYNPRKRFKIEDTKGFSIWNLNERFTVSENKFLSKGKSSPFIGMELYGINHLTVYKDQVVYKK